MKTREELRNALEDEMRGFSVDKDLSSNCIISWNHQEFEVQYASLAEEIKIGALPVVLTCIIYFSIKQFALCFVICVFLYNV